MALPFTAEQFYGVFRRPSAPASTRLPVASKPHRFTVGLLCFAVPPTPRSTLIVPVLWCAAGSQAAFLLGVLPDLGLIAAGLVGVGLLLPSGGPLHTRRS